MIEGLLTTWRIQPKNNFEKLSILTIAVIICFITTGIFFGWGSLIVIYLDEGVYSELCDKKPTLEAPLAGVPHKELVVRNEILTVAKVAEYNTCEFAKKQRQKDKLEGFAKGKSCHEQDLRLALIFTLVIAVINILNPFNGVLLDWWGFQMHWLFCGVQMLIGSLLLAFADSQTFDVYIPASILLANGGVNTFTALVGLSNFYPNSGGFILTVLSTAYDSSTVVFIVYLQVWRWGLKITTSQYFALYSLIPLAMIATTFIFPVCDEELYQNPKTEGDLVAHKRNISIDGESTLVQSAITQTEKDALMITSTQDASKGLSMAHLGFKEHVLSPEYLLCLPFTLINILWMCMFIVSAETRLSATLETQEEVNWYLTVMGWIFPGSFFLSPIIGFIIDKCSIEFVFVLMNGLNLSLGVLLLLQSLNIVHWYIATFVIFSILRSFFYAGWITYIVGMFGLKTFGKLIGIMKFFTGTLSILQYVFMEVELNYLGGKFIATSIFHVATGIFCFYFPAYLYIRKARMGSQIKKDTF